MAGAVILKSKNTLIAGRSPIALGDALHLEAARATAVGGNVNLVDYLDNARVFTQLSGANAELPSVPVIQTVDGFDELDFPKGAGLASAYSALSGAKEVTIYLVFRAALASADNNGVIFRWMSSYTRVGSTNKGFLLRKYAAANSIQWLIDGGANTVSMSQVFSKSGYVVACIGWSVANNISFFNIDGTEVSNTMGIAPPTGGGYMSFGYSPDYATQRCPMGLRTALGYSAYHDAVTRALMVQKLMEDNGLS
ncbi:Uncharacterised protein [Klebsiella pneumoniae]|nr:Uncharacterised protein [Klebsiella pneumoniae]STT61040.1 Uncharacterised protein [Klebsiella pneumoniae]HBY9793018.1 hypothetical protein [Klebsiella pneumoniae]HDU1554239.1 hypothetical protein [Klebsiella pneumoniae]